MADLAMNEGEAFTAVIAQAKAALPRQACRFGPHAAEARKRRPRVALFSSVPFCVAADA